MNASDQAVACPLCAGRMVRTVDTIPSAQGEIVLAECGECSLLFACPPEQFVAGAIFEDPGYMEVNFGSERFSSWAARRHFVPKLKILERHVAPGSILDLGCGNGLFLESARRRGWVPYGCEFNPWLARQAAGKGLAVVRGSAFELPFADSSFRAVQLHHVLEHLSDPALALTESRRVLEDYGILQIGVPILDENVRSLIDRLPRPSWRRQARFLVGEVWPPDHLNFFPLHLVTETLARSGFTVLNVRRTFQTLPFFIAGPKTFAYVGMQYLLQPLLRGLGSTQLADITARRR